MKKTKVLHVIGSLRMGGAESVALSYLKNIEQQCFSFDYLVYGDEIGDLEEEVLKYGGRIIKIPSLNNKYYSFISNVKNVFKNYGPYDVVHSHTLFNSGIIMKIAHNKSIPVRISHAHSSRFKQKYSIIRKLYMFIMRRIINKYSTNLLGCSQDAASFLFSEKAFYKKGQIVRNGIEISKYLFNNEKRYEIRRKMNIENEFLIGHIGRLTNVKNQEFILEVFSEIQKVYSHSKLILVGDGALEDLLKNKAYELGIISKVLFLGSRNDVNNILQGMDVFVFPSKYEGLGISVIEAQASGLKCVVSNNIPKDVDVTNLVERISLDKSAKVWADYILQFKSGYKRMDAQSYLTSNGYDINDSVSMIRDIYTSKE